MLKLHPLHRHTRSSVLTLLVLAPCACWRAEPGELLDGQGPVDNLSSDASANSDAGSATTAEVGKDGVLAPPLLDDAGLPMNSQCLEKPDAGIALDLQLVEFRGRLATLGLDLPADCARGHLVSPAGAPAAILLRGASANFDLSTDCQGNFRALVPPGIYSVRARLQWFDQPAQASATWYADLFDEPLSLNESRALTEPLRARFFTLSGRVDLGNSIALDGSAAEPCLKMAALEQRTDGAAPTAIYFNAHCDGHFSVRVPAGRYAITLNGPFPGKEGDLRLANGTLRLTDSPIEVSTDTTLALTHPVVRLRGQLTADFNLHCQGTKSRLDLRDTSTNATFTLPLCSGAFDGFVPPAQYAASLVSDVGSGSTRILLEDAVDLRDPNAPNPALPLAMSVQTRPASGQLVVNGMPAQNPVDGAYGTLVLLGRAGNGFTGWVPAGMPYAFSARLRDDTYDLSVNAWQFLPGGRFGQAALFERGTSVFETPATIAITTLAIAGELTFASRPAQTRCEGYTLTFQANNGQSTVTATPRCAEGRLRFATALYPGEYRVSVRHANGHVETVVAALVVSHARSDLVFDLSPLPEQPTTGFLTINGCRLRELSGVCTASYTVTLSDPGRGLSYTLRPAFQDQPFMGEVAPGNYRVSIRFAPLCETSPLAAVPGPIEAATPIVVP